jgi:hypothetical protein
MRWTFLFSLAAFLVLAGLAAADTVTTVDNVTFNGVTLSMDDSELHFSCENPGKTEAYIIPRKALRLLEFNNNVANLRAPRGPFLAHEPSGGNIPRNGGKKPEPPSAAERSADTVYLFGSAPRTGHVRGISSEGVLLDGSKPLSKIRVKSIRFAAE